MSKSDETLLKECRNRFDLWYEADKPQREREKEPLRMYALDQWPDAVRTSRDAVPASVVGNQSIPGTPARPCLVLDMLREPVHQIVNQERESDLAIEIIPADDFGSLEQPIDPAEIELREGLVRRGQRQSHAASARSWAFLRAAICGRGYYALNTRYVEGKTFDQEVYYRRIYNQGGVLLDPAHEEPDGSDSTGGFIFSVMDYDAYKAEYPRATKGENKYANCTESDWISAMAEAPDWFTQEGEKKYVRVAEHWYTEYATRTLCQMPDGFVMANEQGEMVPTVVAWKDELPEGAPEPRATREVAEKAIKWCKLDGCQILDKTDWPSPYVPIVKIIGNEIPPHKDERRVDGIINESAIQSQRGRNYVGSRFVEDFGLSTIAPLMVEEGTIEGYEAFYAQANTRAFSYLPFKRTNLDGQPGTAPYRTDRSTNVGQMAQGLQIFNESIQASTSVSNPQMGKPSRHSDTWRGTQALIDQGERGTSNYMDNLERSLSYDGRIHNSLLFTVYGREGRLVRMVKGENEEEAVVVGQPFMMQDNGQGKKRPVPAPPGSSPQQEGVRQYKLTKAGDSANVAIKITRGYDTRRQEEAAMNAELVGQNPSMMGVGGDLYFKSQDGPGAKEWAKRMRVMLDPKVLALLEQEEGGKAPIPPQVQQQMEQMTQQLQQVTQAAQGMQQELQSQFQQTQMKLQGEKEIAALKAQAELELAKIKAAADIQMAQIKAGASIKESREASEEETARQHLAHAQDIESQIVASGLQPEPVMEPQEQV